MWKLVLLRGDTGAGKTTAAEKLKTQFPGIFEIIEVDDIKIELQGSVKDCDPSEDFPEAGRRAKTAIGQGKIAVVVEPLYTIEYVDFVINAARVAPEDVISFWLKCPVEKALERVKEERKCAECVVQEQHSRSKRRHKMPNEYVVETDGRSVDDVYAEIATHLGL